MTEVRVDVKVCEGCGALWLRAATDGKYCRGCTRWLAQLPARPKRVRQIKRVPIVPCRLRAGGLVGGGR